jgi:hypothetical protein
MAGKFGIPIFLRRLPGLPLRLPVLFVVIATVPIAFHFLGDVCHRLDASRQSAPSVRVLLNFPERVQPDEFAWVVEHYKRPEQHAGPARVGGK